MDLASKTGLSRSSLMAEIKQAIIALYREQNPKAAIGTAVLIDEDTGLIKIFAGDNDVGSAKFSQEANQLAQKILIDKIAQGQSNISNQPNDGRELIKKAKSKGFGFLGKFLFWAYNIYFIFFNLSMLATLFINQDFMSLIKNIEWVQTLTLLATFLLPIVSVIYVWRKGLHRQSGNLTKFFFFFELPLATILLRLSSSIAYVTFFTALSIIAFLSLPPLLYVHFAKVELSAATSKVVAFFSQFSTLFLAYFTLLFSFFLPIVVIGLPKMYLEDYFFFDISYGSFANYPAHALQLGMAFAIFLLILGACTLPFLGLRTLWKIFEKSRQKLIESLGQHKADKRVAFGWLIAFTLFLLSLFRWPDNRLLTQLIEFDQKADYLTQETSASSLINEEEKLQKLVKRKIRTRNHYLFDKDNEILVDVYGIVFENEGFARVLQSAFTNLAYPLVYWESWEDQDTLTDNFEYLFGYPHYSQNSQSKNKNEEENEKEVLLTYREITVNTEANGLLANITIEEEYQNQTRQEQEIIYEFNLPDEAAFHDLKLGPNLEFTGIVAPKGAAQKVYEQQLRQNRDPALLEQTGPNQYRLRIFPIPGNNDFNTLQGQRQKVSFSYSIAQNAGVFALPHYTKESNVFVDGSSSITLSYDGQISYLKEELNELPAASEQVLDLCQKQETMNILVEAGRTARVIFHANDPELQKIACGNVEELLPLLKDYRIAIVYDTSSNNQDDQTLDKFADFLSKSDNNWLNEAQLDFYKFNQVVSQGEKITSENFKDLLAPIHFSKVSDFSKLGEIKAQHDLVVLVTSQDIDFSQLKNFPFSKPSMVYWVSEEKLPALNMEMTSGLWQTGGGASTSIESALRNFLIKKTLAEKITDNALNLNQNLSLEYMGLSGNLSSDLFSGSTAFGKIANKGLLKKFVQDQDQEVVGNINQLDQLDLAARQANLVSPYSSLLALVNQQQLASLEREMARYSRFQDAEMNENNSVNIWPDFGMVPKSMIMIDNAMLKTGLLGVTKSAEMSISNTMLETSTQSDFIPTTGSLDSLGGLDEGSNMASSSSLLLFSAALAVIAIVIFLVQKLRNKFKK